MAFGTAETQALLERLLLKESIIDFYNKEAELLDARQYSKWVSNFAEEATYTIPVQKNVRFDRLHSLTKPGELDVAWFADSKDTLSQRVEQLETGVHWAEEPASRIVHIVANVQLLDVSGEGNNRIASTGSCFVVYRNRGDRETDFFIGRRRDKLRAEGESWIILERLVFLEQSVLLAKNLTLFF